jgi:hypothetical protein
MSSTIAPSTTTQRAWLDARIRRHREEVERLRAELGDPEQALNDFVLERFDWRVFAPTDELASDNDLGWDDDDSDAW